MKRRWVLDVTRASWRTARRAGHPRRLPASGLDGPGSRLQIDLDVGEVAVRVLRRGHVRGGAHWRARHALAHLGPDAPAAGTVTHRVGPDLRIVDSRPNSGSPSSREPLAQVRPGAPSRVALWIVCGATNRTPRRAGSAPPPEGPGVDVAWRDVVHALRVPDRDVDARRAPSPSQDVQAKLGDLWGSLQRLDPERARSRALTLERRAVRSGVAPRDLHGHVAEHEQQRCQQDLLHVGHSAKASTSAPLHAPSRPRPRITSIWSLAAIRGLRKRGSRTP